MSESVSARDREAFLSGFDLVWTLVDKPNYLGGEKSWKIAVSHNGNRVMSMDGLVQRFRLGFPLTETIRCNVCQRNESAVDALYAKLTLVEVAFEQAGINLWDGTGESRPWWVDRDLPFGNLHLAVDAWFRMTNTLLEQSWAAGTPVKVSASLLMDSVKHHASGFLGLFSGFQVLTSRQAQTFINYCDASGLLQAGDPGPGGSLFENSMEPWTGAHPMIEATVAMYRYYFTRPERPHGWTGSIAGFGLRCYDCTLAANPDIVNDLRWFASSRITSNSVEQS